MGTLHLLALVYSAGFAILFFSLAFQKRSASHLAAGAGFVFLSLGFVAELVLGFGLDENAARLFYWARGMLALAWFGHAVLLHVVGDKPITRWITYSLIAASVIGFALVVLTQVTQAEDWFLPTKPIYAQINDLLATNRPTRWGALLLNVYGLTALVGGAIYSATRDRRSWLAAGILITAALVIILPLYFSPGEANFALSLAELLAPAFLFFGFTRLLSQKATK